MEEGVKDMSKAKTSSTTTDSGEVTPDLQALKNIDATNGIRRFGGKADAYRKQLLSFRKHYIGAVDKLQHLIAEQGIAAGEEFCHEFKGVCGTLSANELYACTAELDDVLKQGKMPEPAQLENMNQLLQQLMGEIDGLSAPVAIPVAGGMLAPDALLHMLTTLATLLESDMGKAELLLAQLRAGVVGSESEHALAEIADQVDSFAIDEALARISTLRAQLRGKA
jgi:HPt (histidine-containing phosphotransfer) domain-containing protein